MATVTTPHIHLGARRADGSSPEEIDEPHQGYLSLGQIHAAPACYYDQQAEFDAEISRQVCDFDQRRAAAVDSPGRRRPLGK